MATGNTKAKRTVRKNKKKTAKTFLQRLPYYVLITLVTIVIAVSLIFFYRSFVSPYTLKWKAKHGVIAYPDGKVRGIDISHYQEEIEWNKLRSADIQGEPVSFIFVKATEGSDIIDEYFNQNFYNARKNDIIRGAYHFYSPNTSAERQARLFCKIVQLEGDDLPPVLDIEKIGDLKSSKLQSEVLKWLRIVEKHYGVKPIIYAAYKFKKSYLNTPELNEYPFWIAHYYINELSYKGEWSFWQHTDVGRVDGIKGYVDINLFNGTYEDLVKFTINKGVR